MPMGDELKWQLKEGVGIFSRILSPENRPTPFETRPTLSESRPIQVLKNPDITDNCVICNNKQYSKI